MSDRVAVRAFGYARAVLYGARPLLIPLTLYTLVAVALWTTGSMHGAWTFECGVGSTAWDLAHGRNAAFGWSDYYDSWTSGYLLWALLEAPLTWLPWDPIYAVKAVSLATTWGVGLLGFLFLREVAEPRIALLGASALILGPPALLYYAQLGGNYHYTELAPCLALLWRLAVWTKAERWGVRGALELGGLAGLAITTSLGSLLPVALAVGAFALLRPRRLLRGVTWLAAPAAALGAAPLLFKALLHRPFGLPKPEQEFELPYTEGHLGQNLQAKIVDLPGRLTEHLGFGDVAGWLEPLDALFAVLLLAVAGLAIVDGLGALVDRRPERLLPALPGLYVSGLLAAYLVLPIYMPERSWANGFRDVRFLPPLIASGVLAAPLLLARLPRGERLWPAALALPALGLLGWLLLVPWGELQPRIPYSGRCHLLQGMYAGKVVPLVEDGELQHPELCEGFGDAEAVHGCELGRATAPAVFASARGQLRPFRPAAGVARLEPTCAALPEAQRRACFRQIGWALAATGRQHPPWSMPGRLKDSCSGLGSTRDQVSCREGLGYWFADQLGGWPERLELVLGDEPPQVQRMTLAGVGARLSWAFRDDGDIALACSRYDSLVEGGADACLEGARTSAP
jgi:hypothetical protein